tara:strand:- start:11019 stop:13943 length:2925 start_codon:yes stop_codon:yes gene_type:complete
MAQRTINSPGVEIRESDLSLTAPANVGTNIYVTGFAQQGPIDEVLNITTKQELVQVFGTPTNSAERYFHYSINELLNSPATVYASRLPYGLGSGDGFGTKYGALVYPVVTVTGDTEANQVSTFQLSITDFTKGGSYAALSAGALSGVTITVQDSNVGATSTSTISSLTVGFSGGASGGFLVPGVAFGHHLSAGFGGTLNPCIPSAGNVYKDTNIDIFVNTDPVSSLPHLASVIASQVELSSIKLTPTGGSAGALSGAILDSTEAYSVSTNSIKFTLTGDASRASGAPSVSPSVAEPFTGANDTFTLSAASDQGISYDLNVLSGSYVLGEPTHLEISESDYLAGVEGTGITWADTANVTGFDALSAAWGAGVVILNKSTTTINPAFEGYYVGISDNTNLNPATDFDNILFTKTLTQSAFTLSGGDNQSYQSIPEQLLTFKLSADAETGPTNTISEVTDNFTTYDISDRADDDLLNVGVFKLRKSVFANEATKLDYVLEDGITGSINYYTTQLNPNGGAQLPMFLERKDENSRNISIHVNDYISNRIRGTDATNLSGNALKRIRVLTTALTENTDSTATGINTDIVSTIDSQPHMNKADSLYPLGAYVNNSVQSKQVGHIPNKIERALDGIKNNDLYDIDVVVEGGLGTIAAIQSAGSTDFYDEFTYSGGIETAVDGLRTSSDISESTSITLRNNYNAVFNKFEQFCSPPYLGGGRGDCIFVADPIRQILITGNGNVKYLDDKNRNFQTGIYWPIRHQFETQNTSYATVYGNWALVNDSYSGENVYVPFSPFAAASMARTDAAAFPWFAPAGFTRGLVTFANDIAVNPNQKQRDELYKANINPVAQFPGQGLVIFGQKTLSRKSSAFDRINVRRLFLNLERPTRKLTRFFVFENNTEFTRTRLVNALTPIFERAKNNQGVFDYLIVCDERNNTASVIDANELVVDIYIKPTRTAEYILVNFFATRTDANFEEIIGG